MAEMEKYHPDITSETAKRVVYILADHSNHEMETENISRETHLIDDMSYDSLDNIETVLDLEDEFNISIPDDDLYKLTTVGAVIDYVQKALSEKQTQEA